MIVLDVLNNWGGVIGSIAGLLGGAFGTWCSIRGTNCPKERAFMVKAAVWTWISLAAVLGLTFGIGYALPQPYRPWASLVLLLILPALCIGVPVCNRRQTQIRAEESQEQSS